MKKNNGKNDPKEFSFINFYKQINKFSVKNKLSNDMTNKLSNDITHMNFSFKPFNLNNDINITHQKKKLKFRTSKNTPNSSLKNIKLNNADKDIKRKKDFDKKDLFDDLYIRKIKQAYNNRMKINNNFMNRYNQRRSNSNNLINDLSKNKIKNQKSTISKKLYKFDFKENNLNMTNYLAKSKEYLSPNFLSNESNNMNNFEDRIIFTNNYYSGKDNNINENIMISSNYSNLSNTNINNNNIKDTSKILLKYIENRYNNIIRNKIRHKKFIFNNMRNNDDSTRYYMKNNFSYNDKADINNSKRINKINSKISSMKELQIKEKNYAKSFTPISSMNNSMNKQPNLKLIKNNNLIDNLSPNILTKKLNFFSTKNSHRNVLKIEEPKNNINKNENSIEKKNENENKTNNNNNYNININNYNNIKIIDDKNIKEIKEEINDKNKKNDNIKNLLKDIILCMPNNTEDKDTNTISKEKEKKCEQIKQNENTDNKITFISINNNMNITNQNQIINNYAIQLKEKLKNKDKEKINENQILKNIKASKKIINNEKIIIKEEDTDNNNTNKIKANNNNKFFENELNNFIDKQKSLDNKNKTEKELNQLNQKEPDLDLLCNINKAKEEEIDEEKSNLSQSRDCLYYQNELEKLSSYIKSYYSEKKSYPESDTKFYLFGREIGHGAFGKVNLCLHIGSGHLVAMKTFVKKDSKYKESKDKLKNEVEVLSKLHHPFINQILDNFETDTHFFIVMEYICGDLLTFIRKRNKLNESISKVIFKQITEGLRYIHKKNIIHRDIKLDNILIDTTNTVKICDFGVSRKIQRGEKIYERCGTPAYIAPEIYKKTGYTGFQSDVWSAGVTLYYMLSGNLPFKGNNIHDLENAILLGEYNKIRDISYEASDLIEKMLQLNPSERITIEEILKHPWLKNVNLAFRHKLNIFTKAEKRVLSKYYIDYLNSSKADLLENFTYRNLTIDNSKKRLGGNTKSVIYAPYNTCVNENENFMKKTKKNDMSYLSKEEAKLYKELKIENEVCKFGWRVRQANINYELSNNDDYDNGLIKSLNDEEFNQFNHLKKEENYFNDSISIESIKDYEKIQINANILKFIEDKIGYNQKYLIKCLKKNIINYATAAYYLKFKEDTNKNDKDDIIINN